MARILSYALFILCLLTFGINVSKAIQAQGMKSTVDLNQATSAKDSTDILIILSDAYRYEDPNLAISYAETALAMAERADDIPRIAKVYTLKGHLYYELGVYSEALESYSMALSKCIRQYESRFAANCLDNIGNVYQRINIHNLATKSYGQAIKIYRDHDMISSLANTYNNMGISYSQQEEYDAAMQYFNDVLDLDPDSISPQIRALTYSNIGKVFLRKGDLGLAREFNNRAMGISSRIEDQRSIAEAHINSGNIDDQSGDYTSALNEYDTAVQIYRQIKHNKSLAISMLLQAEIYFAIGEIERSVQYTNEAMSIGQDHHFMEIIRDSYHQLSVIYTHLDDIHAAYEYNIYYGQFKDSIYSQQLATSIARTETNNAFHQYEINIDQLESSRKMAKYTRWFVIIILGFSLLTVILALSRLRSQRKANRVLAHQRNILRETLSEHHVSEMKYKALFSQANDAIFIMDRLTFVDCNEKTLEMFGCEREDIIGQPPYRFSPRLQPDGKKSKLKALDYINRCYKGEPLRFYWMHSQLDGTLFDAEVSLNMINLEETTYVQAIVRNISERVRAEKEMVQAREKAEKATQSKTFFLAKMSHEIRTMLGGITSSSQLLKGTSVDKNQKELLDIINNSADNLLSIVNEILDLSKIEAGKFDLENRSFDFVQTLEGTVNTYLQKAKEKKVALYLSLHPKIPEYIKGDELRIKQILANLLSNAIKFTDSGNVTCDVSVVKEYAKSYLIGIKISDTGIGIPANKIKDMFAEYSQSDVSISRRYGGTGLGLNIVYKLITLMKGTIEVSSELEKGTQFTIIVPLSKSDQLKPAVNAPKTELKSQKKYNILLAEDNLVNQKITIINLQNLGFKVDLAEDGNETWKQYQKNKYDIILMDIQMPGLDGIEVTHMIRNYEITHPEKARTRIIAITANILGQDAEYCLAEGMDAYIPKPFKIEDIIAKLDPEEPQ